MTNELIEFQFDSYYKIHHRAGTIMGMKRLLLVDGHSLIHRAYHAFPMTLSSASGELTNVVYGFTRILLDAINDLRPTHVAIAFDLPGPTFRQTMFVGYKRSRVKPDDAMIKQIPRVKEMVQTFNMPIFEVPGFEADDVIGTLARQATDKSDSSSPFSHLAVTPRSARDGLRRQQARLLQKSTSDSPPKDTQVVILTSDRDLMQLIRDERVMVEIPQRGAAKMRRRRETNPYEDDIWNQKRFEEHWGFSPLLLPDYKAFAGDQSDDIPGVRGIGEKTAKILISTFGGVNDVYQALTTDDERLITSKKSLIDKLAEGQESAQMSKQLATIDCAVPIKLDWEETEVHGYDKEKVLALFEELQFKSLIPMLPNDSFEESVQEVLF